MKGVRSEDDFYVGPSRIPGAGMGLYAKNRIRVGETIGYYTGDVITEQQLGEGWNAGSDYLLWVCRNWIIVGEGSKANYTRFINHAEEPNSLLVVSTRWKTARFECVKPILPNEEIYFDYGEEYFEASPVTPLPPS